MFFSIHFILFLVAKNALLTVGFIRNKYIYPHVKKQAACHNRFLTHRPYMIRLLTQLSWVQPFGFYLLRILRTGVDFCAFGALGAFVFVTFAF